MKKDILLFDDDINYISQYKLILSSIGYHSEEIQGGLEGLHKVNNISNLAAIIIDYNLSIINGIDFVKEIKKIHSFNKIPIIMISISTSSNIRQQAYEAGISFWIDKPFDIEIFTYLIKNIGIEP